MLFVEIAADTDGGEATGYSAELLVPKWFAKNPDSTHEADRDDLEQSARAAFAHIAGRGPDTVFGHWLSAQRALVEVSAEGDPLVAMFGVAMIEKAMIDATCRASTTNFFGALRHDALGLRFGDIEERLSEWTPNRLGDRLLQTRVRHTVGLVDDLDESDLDGDDDRRDGHPLTLADDIEAYGLTDFKVKVSGDAEADAERLRRIASLTPEGAMFTLDGNEQYTDAALLADALDVLEEEGGAESVLAGLVSIEQPISRKNTFAPESARGIARLRERAPVIIDEADATLDAYPDARELGYGGVSMKACKGVIRALLNRARIDVDGEGFQSAEDLTNLPTLPLFQDLAVVSALGLGHVERNGHHYFRGNHHLTAEEQSHVLEHHGDLFGPAGPDPVETDSKSPAGPTGGGARGTLLRIEAGHLSLESLDAVGMGYGGPVSLESRP